MTAGGQGLEPRFLGPKPSVLPLDDPPLSCADQILRRTLSPTLTNEDSYGSKLTYVVRMQSKKAFAYL